MDDTRSQPILLIGAGRGAMDTLAELPGLTKDLLVRVAGPFGLIVGEGASGVIRTSNCFWLSEISVPEAVAATQEEGVTVSDFHDAWFSDVCSLIRGLRAGGDDSVQGGGSHVRIHAYVVVDLAAPGIEPFAINLIELVRQVDPSIEMTGLALTGRTAETGTTEAPDWFKPLEEFLTHLQKPDMLQRLYILDGEDISRAWLRTPEQMHRIGARFILHHGLSPYKHHLRRREKTRANLEEGFINFCGSMACKQFSWDPSAAAREIAAALARDATVRELEQGTLSNERGDALDKLAQQLIEDISGAFRGDLPPGEALVAKPAEAADASGPEQKAIAALERTLKEVCSDAKPVLSLHWFLSKFGPRLSGLTTFSRLRVRWESRLRARQALREQVESMRRKKTTPDDWDGSFRPVRAVPSSAVLSHPVAIGNYVLAMAIATAGLGLIAAGGLTRQLALVIAGGIGAICAGLVMVLSTGWVMCPRTKVSGDADASEPVPVSHYEARASAAQLALSMVLLLAGAGCLAWLLHADLSRATSTYAVLLNGGSAACGLVGAFLVWLGAIRAPLPNGVPDERQIPDLSLPGNRMWHIAGLIFLTGAWVLLCLANESLDAMHDVRVLLPGLLSVWGGLALLLLPRHGTAALTYRPAPAADVPLPHRPPGKPVEAPWVDGSRLTVFAEALRSWVDRLLGAETGSGVAGPGSNETTLEEPLPRMFAAQWQSQLANAVKTELESQLGKPFRDIVRDPARWAQCLVQELSNRGVGPTDPLHLFCLSYVKHWVEQKPLEHLISRLTLGRQTLVSAIVESVPPRWPQTRDDPEIDTSLVAVGKELWSMISPFADPEDPHCFTIADWQDPRTITVVRIVQGLSAGWRNYPELPGQNKSTETSEDKESGRS